MGEVISFAGKILGIDSKKQQMPQGMNFEAALDKETQESSSSKPLTWRKGTKLESVKFEVILAAENGIVPRKEYEEWREILNKGEPQTLSIGGRPYIANKMLLVEVLASEIEMLADGKIRKLLMELVFEEYVQEGKKQASGAGGAGNVKIDLSGSIMQLLGLDPESTAPASPEPPATKTGSREQTMTMIKQFRSGQLFSNYNKNQNMAGGG